MRTGWIHRNKNSEIEKPMPINSEIEKPMPITQLRAKINSNSIGLFRKINSLTFENLIYHIVFRLFILFDLSSDLNRTNFVAAFV